MSYLKFTDSAKRKISHLIDKGGKIVEQDFDSVKIKINHEFATIDFFGKTIWTSK